MSSSILLLTTLLIYSVTISSSIELSTTTSTDHALTIDQTVQMLIDRSAEERLEEGHVPQLHAGVVSHLTSPAAVRLLLDGESPVFLEGIDLRGGAPCKTGFGCIYENGVCCPGGEVCCELSCLPTQPPTCGPSPSQTALELAKQKMEEEGKK